MAGRKNHERTSNEALHEYRIREQVERGEKMAGTEAEWLDRVGPAAAAGRTQEALTRHAGGRQGRPRLGPHAARAKRSG